MQRGLASTRGVIKARTRLPGRAAERLRERQVPQLSRGTAAAESPRPASEGKKRGGKS